MLLIAIDQYRHQRPLRAALTDVKALKKVLFQRYGFGPSDTLELYDGEATGKAITNAFRRLIRKVRQDDRVLIYYAGHGYTDPDFRVGYWIPVDGGTDVDERRGWISNQEIRGMLGNLKARNVLLIADSCFSGDLLDAQRSGREANSLVKGFALRSRQVLTSGASEPVADAGFSGHSPFAFHLIDALERNKDRFIDPHTLYDAIRRGVTERQRPLLGGLRQAGHQNGGNYPFLLGGVPPPPRRAAPAPAPGRPSRGLAPGAQDAPPPPPSPRSSVSFEPIEVQGLAKSKHVKAIGMRLSVQFASLQGVDYVTVHMFPRRGRSAKIVAYGAGATENVATPDGPVSVTITRVDFARKTVDVLIAPS